MLELRNGGWAEISQAKSVWWGCGWRSSAFSRNEEMASVAGVQHAEGRETWPGAGAGVGQRRQGWPAFLSLCMAPFSSDMYSSQRGTVMGLRVCRPVRSSGSSSGLLPVAVWPCHPSIIFVYVGIKILTCLSQMCDYFFRTLPNQTTTIGSEYMAQIPISNTLNSPGHVPHSGVHYWGLKE